MSHLSFKIFDFKESAFGKLRKIFPSFFNLLLMFLKNLFGSIVCSITSKATATSFESFLISNKLLTIPGALINGCKSNLHSSN